MTNVSPKIDLGEIRTYIEQLAVEAGNVILNTDLTSLSIQTKKNATDVVTPVDQEIESMLYRRLKSRYQTYAFVGEETYKAGSTKITDEGTFIVDPIDGTANFVHGNWEVCVSIGFTINKEPVVGVVYNPFRSELWSAAKGHGAFLRVGLEGELQSLPLSPPTSLWGLGPACIGLEWSSDREGPNFDLNLHVFTTLARSSATGGRFVHALRFTGSAAQSICRVAAGQQDAFWQCGCWAWDVAAAWCVLMEAGGMMVDGHPGNWAPPVDNRRYLAIRPSSQGQTAFAEQFWTVLGDRRSTYGPNSNVAPAPNSLYPAGVPIKFSLYGVPARYEGNTTICHIPTDSPVIPSLQAVYSALQENSTLSQRMYLVPPASWHVTMLGGVRERLRQPGQWPMGNENMSLGECTLDYAHKLRLLGQKIGARGLSPPYRLRMSGFDVANGVGIKVYGDTEDEEKRLRRLRDLIADEAFGFRTHDHDTVVLHITISYALRHIEGTERLELDTVLGRLLSTVQGSFDLGAVEFCTFKDMLVYERLFYLG